VVAVLRGFGSAVPTELRQDDAWELFFSEHYAGVPVAQRIWARSGVERRHAAVIPYKEDVRGWSTGARMERFRDEALPLGREAIESCLAEAGLRPADVDSLTVVTCTGYGTPGLDVLLSRDLGFRPDVQRLQVGHMGCYAALPALATLADTVSARDRTGILLSVELCSLHVQPPSSEVDQIVAHALFSDAAVAAAFVPGGRGLRFVDVAAVTDPGTAALMTWDVTDLGFRMGLSPEVPDELRKHAAPLVERLLTPHGLRPGDVRGWAVHPGGPRILDVVAEELRLDPIDLADAAGVLRNYGNCSSATVLLVLERLRSGGGLRPGDPVVAMAFGPGLTLYAALFIAEP
jgi:predicted naringenin-chalcone synthase